MLFVPIISVRACSLYNSVIRLNVWFIRLSIRFISLPCLQCKLQAYQAAWTGLDWRTFPPSDMGCLSGGTHRIIAAHWPMKKMVHRAARHRWYSWTLRPWGQQCVILCKASFWRWWLGLFGETSVVVEVLLLLVLLLLCFKLFLCLLCLRCALDVAHSAFRLLWWTKHLLKQSPRAPGMIMAAIGRRSCTMHQSVKFWFLSILCRIYEEVCFQDLKLFCPFLTMTRCKKYQEMLCIDCKKRKHNWMPDVQINSKSADLQVGQSLGGRWCSFAESLHAVRLWVSWGRKVKEPDQS